MKEEKSLMKNMMYYTPEITDFRVGYECEANITVFKLDEGWMPYTLKGIGPEVIHYHSLGVYRTPYITKEDIENEGWEHQCKVGRSIFRFTKQTGCVYKFTNIGLQIDFDNYQIEIYQGSKTYFMGNCPSINELRTIQKLLQIND